MKLTVLGSGSRGNAFAVSARGVSLLLDAGFGPRTLLKRAKRVGLNLDTLVGVVLTHEHGDHARGAGRIARLAGCPVYASRGTLTALADRLGDVQRNRIHSHKPVTIGPFRVTGCHTNHDAAEPMAFVVEAGGGQLGLAYDLGRPTAAVRYLLRDVTTLLLEANHDEIMLRTGDYPPTVRERIAGARGHLSNRAAGQLLAELAHDGMDSVVLVHLSDRCNRPALAHAEVKNAMMGSRFRGKVYVASQDEPLDPITVSPEPKQFELGMAG